MSLAAGERFFSLLALFAGASAIVIGTLLVIPAGRRLLDPLRDLAAWLAWSVAAVAMFGSLWFSEAQNLAPCTLCWYQRIAMYSLAIVLLVGALRGDRGVRWYAMPLASIGILISIYHYVIEWNPQLEATSCDVAVPCSVPYFRELGFVSLSFMAMCGFAAILALMLMGSDAPPRREQQPAPG